MKPRLTGSSLFPYTTLFRSQASGGQAPPFPRRFCARVPRGGRSGRHWPPLALIRGQGPAQSRLFRRLRRRSCWSGQEDRKSTRLNSSHTVISYAVFCLKKKKKKIKKIINILKI